MARDSYRDEYFTSSEIRWLARQTSLSINLLNQNIFNNHNLKLIYNTTVVFPPPKVNITYSAEKGLLTIDNSANNFSIGFELLDPSSESANRIGFKTTVYNDKKTYYNFSSLYPFVDKPFNMVIAFAHNLCFLTPIDDLYKINGENLNKTGFLKYPIHEQTPNYDSTSPYIVYQDSANTDNLKFVGFPEYKINEGKTEENIILNGYCDVKISQGQVDQYNLPYTIANYKNNKELNLVNYCLPLFNNFDNIEYDRLQIKYDTANKQLVFTTPTINGKYKIGKIDFDKDHEKLICYHLPPISVDTKMPNGQQDPKSCLWVQNLQSNLTYQNQITDYYKYYYSSTISSYIGKLHESYQLQCDFSYNPTEAEFLEILVNEHTDQEERISYWIFMYKQYLENYDYLINYKTLSQRYTQQVNWDAHTSGSGLGPTMTFYYNNQEVSAQDAYNWDNTKNEGATNFFEAGNKVYRLLFDYTIDITTKINNFPSFRGNYISFSTIATHNFINHNNVNTSCYNINYKVNDVFIYNYCLTAKEKQSYFNDNQQGENNTQNIIYSNNFIRLNNTNYHNANIVRLNNTDNMPQRQDIVFPKQESNIVHLRWYRYISMGMNTNSSLGLYALWLQTDDTSKQIVWTEYSE